MGCDGCEIWSPNRKTCYAGILHNGKNNKGGKAKTNLGFSPDFTTLTTHRGRMKEAAEWPGLKGHRRYRKEWKNGLPRMIFVSDMSDALSLDIPFSYLLTEIIDVVGSKNGQRHIWQWLTKRPDRMSKFACWLDNLEIEWPPNLWIGTSITLSNTMWRIADLIQVPAAIRFLSIEPQIDDIDLAGHLDGIHWVIQGGESGAGAREFKLEWADSVRMQCHRDDVAYFLKQLGANATYKGQPVSCMDSHGGDWHEWPHWLGRYREFPV